ncbi:type VI secretion system protein TssA [Telluria beijingensis]|uniref:type VI secretion system protein TssA n=1 Tax=Telluria beijingensis TaxID=3068633 RepID=UPI0027955822|nr:type VI secretion system protein TssA [Massilia sp. REN29]
MLDIETLLAPIAPENPCGADLAFSAEVDEIVRARLADDPSLEQGAWVTALKEADWKLVGKRCTGLLETRSKDLQLAVWLAEANAKTGGMRGLADGVGLVAALCERYWDGLHPRADEDGFERRIGNLSWLASRIAPLVKAVPLAEGGAVTLQARDIARAKGPEAVAELEAARARASPAFVQTLRDDTEACLATLEGLERVVDDRLGADGPGYSLGRAALRDVLDLVAPAATPGTVQALADSVVATGAGTVRAKAPQIDGPLQHRDQALAQLRQVAEFFRRTEPHSPVAYLAEKAARWGEQPLHAWLRSVIKDDAALARLEDLLGIEPPAP